MAGLDGCLGARSSEPASHFHILWRALPWAAFVLAVHGDFARAIWGKAVSPSRSAQAHLEGDAALDLQLEASIELPADSALAAAKPRSRR